MLKNRIVTASLLAPLIIAAIVLLPPDGFALFWGAVIVLGAWEWGGLSGLGTTGRVGFIGLILAAMLAARIFALQWAPGELPMWFYIPAVIWWAVWGMAFRKAPEQLVKRKYSPVLRVLAGAFVLITGWVLMVWLRLNFSQYQVLYLVLLIWLADIAAYFTGKRWGSTKLVAAISPGKTVEGVYGAVLAAAVMALLVGVFITRFETQTLLDFVFLSVMTVAFSVSGDLFESLAKRISGVKDSGSMLPGHGGLLDRIDSLLAGVAVFYAGSLLIPIFLQMGPEIETQIIMAPDSVPALEAPGEPGAVEPDADDVGDDSSAMPEEHDHDGHEGHDHHHGEGHDHDHDHADAPHNDAEQVAPENAEPPVMEDSPSPAPAEKPAQQNNGAVQ
jgi:phosphatidate cytidylyltransferase